jgi:pyruvate dehydrogenase E2 component (dihydrolipoamide acetyltransferase)
MADFLLPKLGADMTEGRLVEWLKKAGDRVARGEVIAVIETDKANIEVESWVDGVVDRILLEPGEQWYPVGTPLATLRVDGEAAAAPAPIPARPAVAPVAAPHAAPAAPPTAPVPPTPAAPLAKPAVPAGERIAVSPAARRRAEALGVDLARIAGTGPDGRITLEDVELAAVAKPAAPPRAAPPLAEGQVPAPPPADRRARMREAIAAAMSRAKREIPHYYVATTIDLAPALAWLEARNRERPVTERLLYGVLFLKAVALGLREVPELNGFWVNGRAERAAGVHVGVAISLRGGGLVAPALRDADKQTIDALMRNFQDLVTRARAGTLRSSEMTDATVTVTSLGERGVDSVLGIIYPPQLALVGFGKVVERPWVADGRVVVRPLVTATLSADHRATDGHRGALFLDAIDRLLQAPEKL